MMLPDTACEMQLWYVVMPWRLTLSLAPSWHVVLMLLMPPCSSAACCRMRGSCARWARWCDDVLAAAVVRGDVIEADVVLGAVLARGADVAHAAVQQCGVLPHARIVCEMGSLVQQCCVLSYV